MRVVPRTSTSVDVPLSAAAKRALNHASAAADRMNAPHVGVEHLLLGLLSEREGVAWDILDAHGVRLEEVREEVRLQAHAKEGPPPPREAFQKVVAFLGDLRARNAEYHVSVFRGEAIRVEVAAGDGKWVATFFGDGRVAVEELATTGPVQDEAALARLLEGLGPPH